MWQIEEFTFCTFTFNQASLVLQQLESIKYQILHYGRDVSCHFLLTDDHSTDDTVPIVTRWLDNNSGLFSSVKIMVSDINKGIVRNYETALENIDTEYFKIAAGDDFYYKNDVFDVIKRSNLIISPVINILDDGNVIDCRYKLLERLILCGISSEHLKAFMLNHYLYNGRGIVAPGVFFAKELVNDDLYNVLKDYQWIEDIPQYHFFMGKAETTVEIYTKPLMVYRNQSGISHKQNASLSDAYEHDCQRSIETIHKKYIGEPKYLSPFFYEKGVMCLMNYLNGQIHRDRRKKLLEYRRNMENEKQQAGRYVKMIFEKAREVTVNI